jgi:NAD(P)-dependent dehydrogenase (short-subunit alcohol dehydrogenase family)
MIYVTLCSAHDQFNRMLRSGADASCTMLQTAEKCKAAGASKVETHAADLTDLEGREKLISELLAKHTTVDVLVNNAGMGVKGTPLEGWHLVLFGRLAADAALQ